MADVSRLQVELDRGMAQVVDNLQTLGGLRTKKDVVENALTLFKWAAHEKAFGCVIVAIDPRDCTYSELQMPVLEVIAAKGTAKSRNTRSWRSRVRIIAADAPAHKNRLVRAPGK